MPILYRYIITQILKYFLIVLGAVCIIYLAIDFFERVDNFMEAGLPMSRAVVYFIAKLPSIIAQITPLGVLLAVIIVFSLMGKNHEMMALTCSGIDYWHVLKPVVAIGAVLGAALFFFSEMLVPRAMATANQIWSVEVNQKPLFAAQGKNLWVRSQGAILHIRRYDAQKKVIQGVSINEFDKTFHLVRKVDARQGVFDTDGWRLHHCLIQTCDAQSGDFKVAAVDEYRMQLNFLPEDLLRVDLSAAEISYWKLAEKIRRIESDGYDATRLKVDLAAKISFASLCLILSLTGAGIVLLGRLQSGLSVSLAYGIGAAFVFWVLYSFCLSLGYGAILPPLLAAWSVNIIFFCFSAYMLVAME